MKNPDTDHAPRLPAEWTNHLLPWRGRRTGPEIVLDAAAPALIAGRIARNRGDLDAALAQPDNQAVAAAATAHLDGDPDPAGAAVVMLLLEAKGDYCIERDRRNEHLDAWTVEHGIDFAAAATTESLAITHWFPDYEQRGIAHTIVGEDAPYRLGWSWHRPSDRIGRIRSLLASASESEYEAAVAALAQRRTDPARRLAAAQLMPTESLWVEEACADFPAVGGHEGALWTMVTAPEHVAASRRTHIDGYHLTERTVAALVDGMGSASLPILADTLTRSPEMSKDARVLLLRAIGLIPTDEAVEFTIDHLTMPGAQKTLLAMAERFPDRALRTIAVRARDADATLRGRLAGLARAAPGLLDTALPRLAPADREAIAGLLDDSDRVPDASTEALPELLVAPPWTRGRRKRSAYRILSPFLEDRLVWEAGEQESWSVIGEAEFRWADRDFWMRRIRSFDKHSGSGHDTFFFACAPTDLAAPLLDRWDGSAGGLTEARAKRILSRFGTDVLDRLTPHLNRSPDIATAILPIRSREAARLAADWLRRLKSLRPVAKRWLDRHGPAAVHLLIPDALGTDKQARAAAAAALRHLIATRGAENVTAAAKEYGEEAAAETVTALIDTDPLDPVDVKIPKPPAWADPAMLPQVLLQGREAALPAESVRHLTTVLAVAAPGFPYAGVDVVAATCDRDSLAEYSWALFEQWIAAEAPSKDGWALTQLAHFGGDDAVRRLTPMIRRWPGQSQHKRAVTGLEVLGAIGSESALAAIHSISQKVRFKALKEKATEQIGSIAEGLGLTTEQLGDRLVPDFGLDEASSVVLDYGPRKFKIGLDEQFKPYVTDMDGRPRKSLPKPGAKDDAELAGAAYKRFSQLKKDLRSVAKDQIERLERAMVSGRRWTTGEFQEFFVDHPLMWNLARRLIWLAESGGVRRAFRLAEDKSPTDVDEEEFDLPEDAAISLAHPARLGEDLTDWTEILADYEIIQPFDQLNRPVMAFTADELESGRLTRFEGARIEAVRLLGMTHWGWRRAAPEDAGCEPGVCYALPGGGYVLLSLDPGIYAGDVSEFPLQTVESVHLSHAEDYRSAACGESHPHPTDLDPVTASEVLTALARITKTA
ncbi:DUF4132 domain-containing protein [Glycomyces sp. L485]|uniref:DUF4132 domain-containing protein n=1 Tax=Glycomyces sp. L485 TaxID=2909235 RepID=UPI001F4B86BA|nr:DUF4132 domain-containing protein [Glycomyces sp. L485]MCH7230117.1 DUF4132 domain-containing protein [Glycomyces sp. L485]